MSKRKVQYHCTQCGASSSKWSGQCAECGEWNCLEESLLASPSGNSSARFAGYAGRSQITAIKDVQLTEEPRFVIGIKELDRALGGGLVEGSVTLIGGDPGIGKSTLLIQCMAALAKRLGTVYVTGEESLQQVALRAHRLQLPSDHLQLLSETCVEDIIALAQQQKPRVMVIDSIQTIYCKQLNSAPGSVGQVREATAQLVRFAKQSNTSIFLVGHVTKEGAIAGPRVLEHMVDTVLYFEGDKGSRYRLIRAVKNRFGAVNEIGVFAMTESGLVGINNPSAIFLSKHPSPVAGSAITAMLEGTRPLLVEVQALVEDSPLGNPRRIAVGIEQNRLSMLLAVLHRHAGISMFDQDVYLNAVGGVRIGEPAADLPILLAALSSFRDRPLPDSCLLFGEIGLAGEVRPVPNGQERLAEAVKQGFTQALIPKRNRPQQAIEGLTVHPIARLPEALEVIDSL